MQQFLKFLSPSGWSIGCIAPRCGMQGLCLIPRLLTRDSVVVFHQFSIQSWVYWKYCIHPPQKKKCQISCKSFQSYQIENPFFHSSSRWFQPHLSPTGNRAHVVPHRGSSSQVSQHCSICGCHDFLVGGFLPPIWKILVKLDHFPSFRGKNEKKKCLKPPPSFGDSPKKMQRSKESYCTPLSSLTWRLLENPQQFNWKYIFIHGGFSIVMWVLEGGTLPKTNSRFAPENRPFNAPKENSDSNHPFSGVNSLGQF